MPLVDRKIPSYGQAMRDTIRATDIHPAMPDLVKKLMALGARRLILYGSRARGDHKDYSDIDIAVDWPDMPRDMRGRIFEAVENARTLLKIEHVYYNQADSSLREEIDRDGKEILA